MKKASIIFTVAIAILFTACQDELGSNADGVEISDNVTSSVGDDLGITSITTETLAQASMEEIDLILDDGMEHMFSRIWQGHFGRLECADVTIDSASNTMTVDFGDGCADPRGVLRSGKVIVVREGRKHEPGSSHVVTFEEFSINDVRVEGTRTITNMTDAANTDGVFVMVASLSGGSLSNNSGTITRDSEFTRTRVRGDSVNAGYTSLTGSASGTLSDGTPYTSTILEEIVMTRDCDIRVPVSGVKEFVAGDLTIVIDYGNGECDNLATVTRNGETETIELKSRGDKGPRHAKVHHREHRMKGDSLDHRHEGPRGEGGHHGRKGK